MRPLFTKLIKKLRTLLKTKNQISESTSGFILILCILLKINVMNRKKSSKNVASLAAKTLNSNQSSTAAKKLAGSALSQYKSSNQTGAQMEEFASSVLKSFKYNKETKKLAASVLSQSNKKR